MGVIKIHEEVDANEVHTRWKLRTHNNKQTTTKRKQKSASKSRVFLSFSPIRIIVLQAREGIGKSRRKGPQLMPYYVLIRFSYCA